MSIIVPLHKWRSADPAILIGRRCIARTDDDVVIDARLELIRHPDGTAICASNGIGPGRCTFPRYRLQHCVVCGRWWRASAVSTHLTIWTEMPDWIIRMLWHSIWESAENHPTQERGNHE